MEISGSVKINSFINNNEIYNDGVLDMCIDIINILKSEHESSTALHLLQKLYLAYDVDYEHKLFNKASGLVMDSIKIRIELHNTIEELLRILKEKVNDRKKQVL